MTMKASVAAVDRVRRCEPAFINNYLLGAPPDGEKAAIKR